jgi:hypothetical protein
MSKYKTREEWLEAAVELMTPVFKSRDYKVPKVRVSCSFPSKGGTAAKSKRLGECWDSAAASDNVHQIFITPLMDSATGEQGVLSTLLHEVVHAVVGIPALHGPKFKACALAVGLSGKMTATVAGPELLVTLAEWETQLGPYPHSKLNPTLSGKKKQSTRMRKCQCPECGYTVRTTLKWIEARGIPWCPVDGVMIVEEKDDSDE